MKNTLTQVIGLNVKRIRQRLGLTQKALADKVEVTQAALSYIEKGERNPSVSTLDLLANALDTTAAILVWDYYGRAPKENGS